MTGPLAWYLVIVVAFGLYVLLDGYDLGVGTLLLRGRDNGERREMVDLIATAWDGNESWLVLVGVALYGGLPTAYATVLPALYLPLVVMLLALIARGVSIEMQAQTVEYDRFWGLAFGLGSLVAAFAQGVVLGGLLSGVHSDGARFTGGAWSFLNGFDLLMGVTAVALDVLAGAAWLFLRTGDRLRSGAARDGRAAVLVVAVLLVADGVLLATVTWTDLHLLRPLVLGGAVLACAALVWTLRGFGREHHDGVPFAGVVVGEAAGLVALVAALYPVIVPPGLTLATAASPRSSVNFLLIGVLACAPFVLAYNAYAYWVFRGKFPVTGAGTGTTVRGVTDPTGRYGPGQVSAGGNGPGSGTLAAVSGRTSARPGRIVASVLLAVLWVFLALVAMNTFAVYAHLANLVAIPVLALGGGALWMLGGRRNPEGTDPAPAKNGAVAGQVAAGPHGHDAAAPEPAAAAPGVGEGG